MVYRTQLAKSAPLRIAQQYQRIIYTSLKSTFSAQRFSCWQCRSIFICLAIVASQTCQLAQNSEKSWTYSSSSSSKVDYFGTNRKRIYQFLLVINSNFGRILHHFWDTATYWLKIAYFSYHCVIRRPRSLSSLWNFTVKLSVRKLMGQLLCGKGCTYILHSIRIYGAVYSVIAAICWSICHFEL